MTVASTALAGNVLPLYVVVTAKLMAVENAQPGFIFKFAADPPGTGITNNEAVVPRVTEPDATLKN